VSGLPVFVSAIVQLPGLAIAAHDGRPIITAFAALAFLASFMILLSRRAPGATVVIVSAMCSPAIALVGGPPLAAVPLVFAVMAAVMRASRGWVWGTLAGVALIPGIAWFVISAHPGVLIRVLIVVIVLCVVVGMTEAARSRRERYRAYSREIAARRRGAAEAERLRLARELHDVLAHSLSQISVQAGVGLHLFDTDPERARESLSSIKAASTSALDDVRGVLGMLRNDGESDARTPEPDLSRLDDLVANAHAAGVTVTLDNRVGAGAPAAVQLTLYRIVQESLTNVIKHSAARVASVELDRTASDYRVTVTDPGPATARTTDAGDASGGRGLVGMGERAALLGGVFESGSVPGGGFRVHARLPVAAAARGGDSA
jgi:signal transduction histidine kinase